MRIQIIYEYDEMGVFISLSIQQDRIMWTFIV